MLQSKQTRLATGLGKLGPTHARDPVPRASGRLSRRRCWLLFDRRTWRGRPRTMMTDDDEQVQQTNRGRR
jgi:hypothetical protein